MEPADLLSNVTIILCDTKTPANIGAVARCMMNMGLSRLALVNPLKENRDEALRLAAGADSVLERATVSAMLEEALAGQHLVVGASRHPGKLRRNVNTPRAIAEGVVPLLGRNRVAFVFGSEVNGLDNRQLALCHEIVAIPSSPAFASLNLSHAVMVVAYELFVASGAAAPAADRELAPAEELERFYRHLEDTLRAVDFLDDDRAERIMFSLRQLFGRCRPDSRDVSILRGILTAVDRLRSDRE